MKYAPCNLLSLKLQLRQSAAVKFERRKSCTSTNCKVCGMAKPGLSRSLQDHKICHKHLPMEVFPLDVCFTVLQGRANAKLSACNESVFESAVVRFFYC